MVKERSSSPFLNSLIYTFFELLWIKLVKLSILFQLYAKLKSAARHIGQLARERQQLIEMGNRLRSELARYTGKSSGGAPTKNPWDTDDVAMQEVSGKAEQDGLDAGKILTSGELANRFSDKLSKLEKLQYALTKQVWVDHKVFYSKRVS